MSQEKTLQLLIEGEVQGVSFRAWTRSQAQALDLRGFVRNLSDGRVEAVLAGPHDAVDSMVDACREGPRHARVDDIRIAPWNEDVPGGFEIRETR